MRWRFTALISTLLLAIPVHAETLRLTLPEAVRMALGSGTQAELARSAAERATIAQREAFSALLPQVDARLLRYSQSINLATFGFEIPGQPPVVGPFNVTDAQLAAAMQVFNLAALRHLQALRQAQAATRYDVEAAENDVAAAVARLYLLTQRAATQVASRQADVALFERLQKAAQDELAAGTGTRLDVAQANVQVVRARQALLVAQNDEETAKLALLNAIGANEASDVVLFATAAPPVPARGDAIARARAQRPELKELAAREAAARLGVDAARARRLPSIGFEYQGDLSGNKTDDLRYSRRIAGVLSVPLLHGDIEANIARAKLEQHDVEVQRAQRERDVEQDVRRAELNVQNANARATVAEESVRVAEEALTVARDRRAAGYGSPVEVDRAQDIYRQAREDLIAARADAAAAAFDLAHATGDIRGVVAEAKP
jgi:cobalt-zinc-cadmium efflux system outer membrane protein